MKNLLMTEIKCAENFAYILNDSSLFLKTEYKILQGETTSFFLKCVKIMYNGKEELYYDVESCRPLSLVVEEEDAKGVIDLFENLFCHIKKVGENGFLSPLKLQLSADKIWVDPSTKQVKFVYLPLTKKVYDNMQELEGEFRKELLDFIKKRKDRDETCFVEFSKVICQQGYLLGYERKEQGILKDVVKDEKGSECKIISLVAGVQEEFVVKQKEFIIGKNAKQTDGTVSFSRMVSRKHCKIIKKKSEYFVVDLSSSNGTFLNGMRLVPGKEYVIHNRDVLRLATSDFQIMIE